MIKPNEKCCCGSNLKYKKCCRGVDEIIKYLIKSEEKETDKRIILVYKSLNHIADNIVIADKAENNKDVEKYIKILITM